MIERSEEYFPFKCQHPTFPWVAPVFCRKAPPSVRGARCRWRFVYIRNKKCAWHRNLWMDEAESRCWHRSGNSADNSGQEHQSVLQTSQISLTERKTHFQKCYIMLTYHRQRRERFLCDDWFNITNFIVCVSTNNTTEHNILYGTEQAKNIYKEIREHNSNNNNNNNTTKTTFHLR